MTQKPYLPSLPFRILGFMLYGEFDWLIRRDRGVVVIKTSAMAKRLYTAPKEVWKSLRYLKDSRFILDVQVPEHRRGAAIVTLRDPISFSGFFSQPITGPGRPRTIVSGNASVVDKTRSFTR